MPTYEYECKSCGHGFEIIQAISDPPLKNCPQCGKEVRRLIFGGAGVIFKGPGFYVTDKGKADSNKKPAGKESKPASSTGDSTGRSGAEKSASAGGACANCPAAKQCQSA